LKNTEFGKKVLDKLDEEEIAKMDADEIMARQMEELEREKKELRVRN
jgi:translation initiation factor 3 subunit A